MGIRTADELVKKVDDEEIERNFEFSSLLGSSETLVSLDSITVTPVTVPPLVVNNQGVGTTEAQVQITGGLVNTRYKVIVQVTTSEGQVYDGAGECSVAEA